MPISNFLLPISTTKLAVSMNGRPKINGISASSLMSMTTKSAGKVKCFTQTKTSSITPYGLVMERSANCRVILVGIISSSPIVRHIENDIKFMLAPKSIRALPTETALTKQGIVTLHGSLCLGGRMC